MALDLQEQEQLAQFKAWWHSWGKYLFAVLGIAVLSYLGYKSWQAYQLYQSEKVSTLFVELDKARDDPKKIVAISKTIVEQYPNSAYAPRAALMAAKANWDKNDAAAAKAQLEWVIAHAKEASLRDMAHLRLAGLFLDNKQYSQALAQLKTPEDESYSLQYQELKGDVLAALGKRKEAIEAYKQALAKAKFDATYRTILEVKLDSLESK
jgi:predicted negative regulator of RcsB-dependent stress response